MPHPPEYLAFLRAWLDFAEDPSNNPYAFHPIYGLCTNSSHYGWTLSASRGYALYDHLYTRLKLLYGDTDTPFNPGGHGDYVKEQDKTKNPERLAFVRRELGL